MFARMVAGDLLLGLASLVLHSRDDHKAAEALLVQALTVEPDHGSTLLRCVVCFSCMAGYLCVLPAVGCVCLVCPVSITCGTTLHGID